NMAVGETLPQVWFLAGFGALLPRLQRREELRAQEQALLEAEELEQESLDDDEYAEPSPVRG
ncbi:MAG TPA: hypothetical protein PKH51_11830, partial [Candidatus Sumerlaeota bacterium]|nr:hypothetical protein [Candidatus Sumerlaeota bacterium]